MYDFLFSSILLLDSFLFTISGPGILLICEDSIYFLCNKFGFKCLMFKGWEDSCKICAADFLLTWTGGSSLGIKSGPTEFELNLFE